MEAKDADRSHQDICHFVATASLISDEASSPVGAGLGGVEGGGGVVVSLSSGCAKQPSKSCGALSPKQLVPITANHRRSVPLISILVDIKAAPTSARPRGH